MAEGVAVVIEPGTAGEETVQAVRRSLTILYGTRVGEQALDRDFGLEGDWADAPQARARTLLAAEIVRKTAHYEPRARVERVEWGAADPGEGETRARVVVRLV